MKKTLPALLGLSTGLLFMALHFEEDFLERIVKKMDAYQQLFIHEKVYLHIDRPHYLPGETIWFSAYATFAASGTADTLSRLVYVDLLNTETQEVLFTRRIRMTDGLGQGDIFLPDDLLAGPYRLRGYTHWMRNFSEEHFFYRDFHILANEPAAAPNPALTSEIDVQFMPEGGYLIQDIDSKVAFKAIDSQGKGIPVTGFVLNQSNDTLAGFRTEHLGMGQFMFKPQADQTYRIQVRKPDGGMASFPFPVVKQEGAVLIVDNLSNKQNVRVFVRSNSADPVEMALIAHNQGDITYANKAAISSKLSLFTIPRSGLGDGITHLTLFDANSRPIAERLLYNRLVEPLTIKIQSSKNTYKIREKVDLTLEVSDADGKPIAGNFSVAVTDGNQASIDANAQHIVSYFRLEADLRGGIEQPASYFDTSNPNAARYLDLLLMTQGWRRFRWEDVLKDQAPEPSYFVEQGITLTGKLVRKNKRAAGIMPLTFTLLQKDSSQMFVTGESIATGEFALYGMDVTDSTDIMIQIADSKKAVDVKIQTDRWMAPPYGKVPFRAMNAQPLATDMLKRAQEYLKIERTIRENREKLLQEVVIKGKKVDPITSDSRRALYKRPSSTLAFTDRNTVGALTIFDVIKNRIPSVQVLGSGPDRIIQIRGNSNLRGTIEPMYMMDGSPVSKDVAMNILPSSVESVDVIVGPAATVYGDQGRGGVINILTKNGNPNQSFSYQETEGSLSTRLMGYDPQREFYAPRYDQQLPEHVRPDYRPTLLWAPRLRTGSDGKATVSFFASDATSTLQIRAEGMARNGMPGVGQAKVVVVE
ncbi:TonB-dependent receptor [Arundinibacter roseus]|uniref:TonB-dependent receptor n=1 Tax=Arundinibacter roseus TaxID=2070510 RepID=A0A4R4K0N8_9BACT|nr:TonB-dependent receptor plug domain-containing protein [Arundinibacter roseus]TDB60857.1 TonB-dependent receptor [Arundinibacter roseus]